MEGERNETARVGAGQSSETMAPSVAVCSTAEAMLGGMSDLGTGRVSAGVAKDNTCSQSCQGHGTSEASLQHMVQGVAFGVNGAGVKKRFGGIVSDNLDKEKNMEITIKRFKSMEVQLEDIRKLAARRMFLTQVCCVLAIGGIALTAITAEVCRYGYVPTVECDQCARSLSLRSPLPSQRALDPS